MALLSTRATTRLRSTPGPPGGACVTLSWHGSEGGTDKRAPPRFCECLPHGRRPPGKSLCLLLRLNVPLETRITDRPSGGAQVDSDRSSNASVSKYTRHPCCHDGKCEEVRIRLVLNLGKTGRHEASQGWCTDVGEPAMVIHPFDQWPRRLCVLVHRYVPTEAEPGNTVDACPTIHSFRARIDGCGWLEHGGIRCYR